jgi:hypothetical protein
LLLAFMWMKEAISQFTHDRLYVSLPTERMPNQDGDGQQVRVSINFQNLVLVEKGEQRR